MTYLPSRVPEANVCSPAIGYAVPRAVGSAVVRNRLRRRLRAAAGELVAAGRWPSGDYLVGASPAATARTYAELRDTLAALAGRVVEP